MAMGFASLLGALAVLWLALVAGPAGAGELRIVAFGDSLTAGFGLKARDAFPAVLERHLRAQGLAVVPEEFQQVAPGPSANRPRHTRWRQALSALPWRRTSISYAWAHFPA